MNVLILQPVRPDHPRSLRLLADALLAALPAANPTLTLEIVQDDRVIIPPPSPSKYAKHAAVRNALVDAYLRPEHDTVLWIDSDMASYPPDLPTRLVAAGPIAAPLVLLDTQVDRYYDIGGFIEAGRRFNLHPPYCSQTGPLWRLDSVGCCYTYPAALYRDGIRYAAPPTDYYVEHWSVMTAARERGIPIVALSDMIARHAWLPMFGLGLN